MAFGRMAVPSRAGRDEASGAVNLVSSGVFHGQALMDHCWFLLPAKGHWITEAPLAVLAALMSADLPLCKAVSL